MFRNLWQLLKPFRPAFLRFFFLITLYEAVEILKSYTGSLIVNLFSMDTAIWGWVELFIFLYLTDRFSLWLDKKVDYHIISEHSHPIYKLLKLSAIKKFMKMDIGWHHKHNSGTLVGKVSDGVWKTLEIIDALSWEFVPTLVQMVLTYAFLLYLSPWTVVVAIIALAEFVRLTLKGNNEKAPHRERRQDFYEEEWNKAVESVQSIETNLMFGQQERLIAEQERIHDGIINEARQEHYIGIYKYNHARIMVLNTCKRAIQAIWVWQLFHGQMDIAGFIFSNTMIERLFGSYWRFARIADRAVASSEGSGRLVKLLNESEPPTGGEYCGELNYPANIVMQNVCFAYEGDYDESSGALHGMHLDIKAGQIVAIVGPSGAGKTTLRKVITKLSSIQQGNIEVAGVSVQNWNNQALLKLVSYVPQGDDVYIYDDTIFANIAFPNPNASNEEINEAARLAGISSFIESLDSGYQTKVGERGVRLSGGQKQRVALARAILANRPILILDEATSAVDAITEKEIQENMQAILAGKTAIIIAHRLSTIWNLANKIVVMDNGRKIEEGTHDELMDLGGLYAHMVSLQTHT